MRDCTYCKEPAPEDFLGMPVCRSCNILQREALDRAVTTTARFEKLPNGDWLRREP